SAEATGSTQERTALPSRCTVQAPHIATPQPYLVPVRPACSRIAHRRGVLGSTLSSMDLPLMVKRAIASPSPDYCAVLRISAIRPPKTSGFATAAVWHPVDSWQHEPPPAPHLLSSPPPSRPRVLRES